MPLTEPPSDYKTYNLLTPTGNPDNEVDFTEPPPNYITYDLTTQSREESGLQDSGSQEESVLQDSGSQGQPGPLTATAAGQWVIQAGWTARVMVKCRD